MTSHRWVAWCPTCGDARLRFDSPTSREEWAAAHLKSTGHTVVLE